MLEGTPPEALAVRRFPAFSAAVLGLVAVFARAVANPTPTFEGVTVAVVVVVVAVAVVVFVVVVAVVVSVIVGVDAVY